VLISFTSGRLVVKKHYEGQSTGTEENIMDAETLVDEKIQGNYRQIKAT